MSLSPRPLRQYHVFVASPGDVQAERQQVRRFFDDFNRQTAHLWQARFEVIDWENCASIGVGRPQELITRQTLERHHGSLALVIGIMAQRFGSPSGKAESGTEEEFDWALTSHTARGFPEIKWFFRKIEKLEIDPDRLEESVAQWTKVKAFRQRLANLAQPVWCAEYPGADGFSEVFRRDLNLWLAEPARPWAAGRVKGLPAGGSSGRTSAVSAHFDAETYGNAVRKRFGKLSFEMLDTTGAYYSGVQLWSVFIPQSVRECHKYNPRLLEIPKEHQQRLLDNFEITAAEVAVVERQADQLRQQYFSQPLRPVLEVVDEALTERVSRPGQRLVVLGDPGSGKSSLIRFLALRWAHGAEPAFSGLGPPSEPIPLVVDLGNYARWACEGRRSFVRFLEDAPVWHTWPQGMLDALLRQSGRTVLLLDGLDEVFDVQHRADVVADIQRLCGEYPQASIIVTSRVVGYAPERLRDVDFRHFMLQDLDADQIDAFLDRWHDETFDDAAQAAPKRERLKRAIRDSKSIAMLAGNPLLLTMMAILNRHQELPRDRAELYGQASRVLLHQWDTERALIDFPGLSSEIGLREKSELLRRVAFDMQAGPGGLKGNLTEGARLERLIESYLRDELHFDQARAAARTVVQHLRQRNFILCFVGADSYAFVHRTLLEYFCAAELVHRFNVAKTLDIAELVKLFDDHCRDYEWHEVLRLICAQIDEVFVGEIVEHLATRSNLANWDGTPLPELPLAIGCMGEARAISRLEGAAATLTEALLRVYIPGSGWREFHQQLLASEREVGTRWPGAALLAPIPLRRQHEIDARMWAADYLVKFIACVYPDRNFVEKWVTCQNYGLRSGAVEALAEISPDDATRTLLAQRAIRDDNAGTRGAALEALARTWLDDATRTLLAQRAVDDDHYTPRRAALKALAKIWPDDATRTLVAQRAVQDDDKPTRRVALEALAETWPDDATRTLVAQRAIQDDDNDTRRAALEALAKTWPDDATRTLVAQRAVQDHDIDTRSAALEALAKTWPDDATRTLLAQRAVQDDNEIRRAALRALARTWPDDAARTMLVQRAVHDDHYAPRRAALEALAKTWPDDATRTLLAQRAAKDDHFAARSAALEALAENWPDDATRTLVAQRAIRDEDNDTRRGALEVLAQTWPDDASRALVAQRALQDDDSHTRRAAIEALAKIWPDDATRTLVAQRAVQDDDGANRGAALEALARTWPDDATRTLLAQRAVQDDHHTPRRAALEALTKTWPDDATRTLVAQRAVQDDDDPTRRSALKALAKTWRDDASRALVAQRAVQDDDIPTRRAALDALAETWPDDATRSLLTQRAVQDNHFAPRCAALEALAKIWPDDATRELLAQCAFGDPDPSVRGRAWCLNAAMHSRLGRILPTKDLDGIGPFLDPVQPVPRNHIEEAAARAGILPGDIDAQLGSLSAFLGWDVALGLMPAG